MAAPNPNPNPPETPEESERRRFEILKKSRMVCGPELYEVAKIEPYEWYMGMLGRVDVEPYLKKQGEFAIRAHDHRTYSELILSVRSLTMCNHITLSCDKSTKSWTLTLLRTAESKFFSTIPELIEHYKKNFLPIAPPNDKVVLTVPCKRPKWVLKRSNLEVDRGCLLGSGNFCDVYKGKLNKRRIVAIKICHASSTDDKKTEEQVDKEFLAREALVREGHLMQSIRHWNVISFFGVCFDKPPVMIVMEFCPGGSLVEHLLKFGDKIPVGERLKYAQESADGMAHLHSKGCIHRDLAARNCLISKYGIVKIADFGLSKLISEVNGDFGTKQQVPIRWMAPESIQRNASFTDKSDVWSYGMLLYEIFNNGERPWEDWESKKVATYIRRVQMPTFPARTPPQIIELVKEKIWILDPVKRENFAFIVTRLAQIVTLYPYLKIETLTINEIPNVQALTPDEIQALQDMTEDVAMEVVASTMSEVVKPPTAGEMAIARERDVTVDESTPPANQAPYQQRRERVPSKKRISRKIQRTQMDNSRETSHEQVASNDGNDKKQKPKLQPKGPVQPAPAVANLQAPANPMARTPIQQLKPKSPMPGQK